MNYDDDGRSIPPSFIYFIQDQTLGLIKIGYSSTHAGVSERMTSLQVGNPFDLVLVAVMEGSVSDEKKVHEMFEYARCRGEWFRPFQPLVEYISSGRCYAPVRGIPTLGEEPLQEKCFLIGHLVERWGRSKESIRKLVVDGKLRAFSFTKPGMMDSCRNWRFAPEDVREYEVGVIFASTRKPGAAPKSRATPKN